MPEMKLVIGEKNRSAASLSAWLTLRQLGAVFEEVVIPSGRPDSAELVHRHAHGGRLPCLEVDGLRAWDVIPIGETLAEQARQLWPADTTARAFARSAAAEMQAGLPELCTFLPMDVTGRFTHPGRLLNRVAADLRRLVELWTACRLDFGGAGPFLFGRFSLADAVSAPLCARLVTHGIVLDELSAAYVGHMMRLPAMLEWAEAAAAEVSGRPMPLQPFAGEAAPAATLPPQPAAPPPPVPRSDEDAEAEPLREIKAVIPQHAFGEESATPDARRIRPAGRSGIFRWRPPPVVTRPEPMPSADPAPEPPPPIEEALAPPVPLPRPTAPARIEAAATPPQAAEPEPPTEPQALPRWLAQSQAAAEPTLTGEMTPVAAEEPVTTAPGLPLPAWLTPREQPPAQPEPPPRPDRPITRPGTIKPIGDGTRRRR